MNSICVYCGSADNLHPDYFAAARRMGASIAGRGWQLWYGAGSTGLMGAVADAALEAGGEVIGVLPEMFNTPKLAHTRLTRMEIVDSMHIRKYRLALQADAFVALPGGFGTLEEFFEILTWSQIGLHQKPVGLLNVRGYYDLLLKMVELARQEGFIYNEHSALFTCLDDVEALLDALAGYRPPSGLERWLTRED
jgi:uncharacterized protein (TIGR00730 family)